MSCASPGNCAAGGSYQDAVHHDQVFAAIETNGIWGPATPIPNLATLNAGGLADVTSVSCGEAGDCAIGGSYENAQHDDIPWVDDSVAGTWRMAHGLITTNLTSIDSEFDQHFGVVNSISCAVAGRCAAAVTLPALVAIGSQLHPEAAAYIATELNGIWGTPMAAPIVSSGAAQLPAELNSVSCAGTPTFCIAGGYYTDGGENQHAIIMFGDIDFDGDTVGRGGRGPALAALPGYNTHNPFATVSSVSCLPSGDCAASGFYTDTAGHHQAFTGNEDNGSPWTHAHHPRPSRAQRRRAGVRGRHVLRCSRRVRRRRKFRGLGFAVPGLRRCRGRRSVAQRPADPGGQRQPAGGGDQGLLRRSRLLRRGRPVPGGAAPRPSSPTSWPERGAAPSRSPGT